LQEFQPEKQMFLTKRGVSAVAHDGAIALKSSLIRWRRMAEGAPTLLRFRRLAFRQIVIAALATPVVVATLYYGLLASDRYVSEASFIVRGVSARRPTGLDMLFQTLGIARAVDDTNAVQQYMLSRDALRAMEAKLPLRKIFSDSKGDYFARFPYFWTLFERDSFERMFDYYLDHVTVVQDPSKGITTLKVVTFDAAQSQQIARTLLLLAEDMVNRLNDRAQNDAVRFAQADVERAEKRLIKAQLDLTDFRNRELLIDPSKNSVAVLETITNLTTELNHTLALIEETGKTAPSHPSIHIWRAKTAALQAQIDKEREKLAGRDGALAPKIAVYEQLALARELAEKGLAAGTASLEAARQEARRQQIYIEEITLPNLVDAPTEPRRLRTIATVAVTTFSLAAVLWILSVGAKEHSN
jgi:capsular polysaccharide transport system permease protein